MNKNILIVGFMLFAIFFGAGNLIFPPKLGLESGAQFWPAIIGFIVTGVGLPLLGMIIGSFDKNGYQGALKRIHPAFSMIFLIAIYLCIGPFFAIPRTGSTVYEMAILPFLDQPSSTSLLIFTACYFALSLWLAINPSKMVDHIGSILTPALLISIFALVIRAAFIFDTPPDSVQHNIHITTSDALVNGFFEGYQTLDALAAVAFSVVVINAIRARGIEKETSLIKQTSLASIIAAVALAAIYIGIAWIGNHITLNADTLAQITASKQDLGTYILTTAAEQTFGEYGRLLLSIIVGLACLTTTIGLLVSVSEFFNGIFNKISYKAYIILFALFGFLLANQGLKAIISTSVPVLLALYPIAITLMFLLLVDRFIPLARPILVCSVALVTIVSILMGCQVELVQQLPLSTYKFQWLPFAFLGIIIGVGITLIKGKKA